jgi:hypothetical protein
MKCEARRVDARRSCRGRRRGCVSQLSDRSTVLVSAIPFPATRFWGRRVWRLSWGTALDSTALQALIAEVRGTAAALTEAEQRVASFTAELPHQDRAQHDAKPAQQIRVPVAKRGNSGWVPAG